MVRLSLAPILALILCAAVAAEDVYTINDFKRSYFKIISQNNGFYKVNTKLEAALNELPIAFGFVDRDFYTDIVTATQDSKAIAVHLFNEQEGIFERALSTTPLGGDEKVISARVTYVTQASDFPNILVISKSEASRKLYIHAYQITSDQNQRLSINELANLLVAIDQPSGQFAEPVNFQISNDERMTEYWLVVDGDVRTALSYDRSQPNTAVTKTPFSALLDATCTGCKDFTEVIKNQLAAVGSHAFLDLDGDGRADLVLEGVDGSGNRVLEFYVFQNSGKFGFTKTISVPHDYGVGSFVDLQERQAIDLVFWNKKENKLYIHWGSKGAAGETNEVSFPSLDKPDQAVPTVLDLLPGARIQENANLNIQPILRFADLTLNGYQDLIINTVDADGANNVHLFPNLPCNNTDAQCRTFASEIDLKTIGVLKGRNVVQSSLFDFGERG